MPKGKYERKERNTTAPKTRVQLPKGYQAITSGDFAPTWDFRTQPVIEGILQDIREIPSKLARGKKQRLAVIRTKIGDLTVWESVQLRPLFDVKRGKKVAIVFGGFKKIPGRKQPMKEFSIGVM